MFTYICNKSIKVWIKRTVVTSGKEGKRVRFGEFLKCICKIYFFKKNQRSKYGKTLIYVQYEW